MRDWANLDDPSISSFGQRGNKRLLQAELGPDERILAVSVASTGGLRTGLLAVTEHRVVFVGERLLRPPTRISLRFDEVTQVRIGQEPLTGTLHLDIDGGVVSFRSIKPKERLWPLYWRAAEGIGQLPGRRHGD